MLDAMAERYSILPSKLLQEADTFDLMVMDVALTYRHYKESKHSQQPTDTSVYDENDLMKKLEKARGESR
jgi:hypothetical protein